MDIKNNLELVREGVAQAAALSGRKVEDIRIVAVTKTVDADTVKRAFELGISSIGENRVQEMMKKYEVLKNYELDWHMIGHLQRNKVKYIIDKVALIHSVDSISLAREINKRAGKSGKRMQVLVQINVSGEKSKYGIDPDHVHEFMEQAEGLENIHIMGLMTIAPYVQDPEEARPEFSKLRGIFEDVKDNKYSGVEMELLSMGMTGDYKVAIEEGANIVRIGTGIFGKRSQ